ncbi:MAG: alkaline phosphatase PhoX [Planctomycetota bacterium]
MYANTLSRRGFLVSAAAVSAGFMGLRAAAGAGGPLSASASGGGGISGGGGVGYGPLMDDPAGMMKLPEGFSYRVLSRTGDEMADGLLVPGLPDGMAAFEGPGDTTVLVRNHEIAAGKPSIGAFGEAHERLGGLAPEKLYDPGDGTDGPILGGCTRVVVDNATGEVVGQHLALAGTVRNCAGGPTPWGTWVTCEEDVRTGRHEGYSVDHGYNFEVPSDPSAGVADPLPIKAMGRFNHEAIAVDPRTGAVYQTEDRHEGLIYRYLPKTPGRLHDGGRLQALAVKGQPGRDTRNWPADTPVESIYKGGAGEIARESFKSLGQPAMGVGEVVEVEWIDVDDVEAPSDDLRFRWFDKGAARFARGEGMWYGRDSVFFACTNGGRRRLGQVFRYVPSPFEGTADEAKFPGRLELFIEPNDSNLIENADNLTVAPTGDLIVCEDRSGTCRLIGVTPEGQTYLFGGNVFNRSELAGACFSPDGATLFVNIQSPGITLAIRGPWAG